MLTPAQALDYQTRCNAWVDHHLSPLIAAQVAANLPALRTAHDAASLAAGATNARAAVVGAGPSLDHALEALRRFQHERSGLVIAVDTAARPLLVAGVTPDYVVTLDPSGTNAGYVLDPIVQAGVRQLVANVAVPPAVLAAYAGRVWVYQTEPVPALEAAGLRVQFLPSPGSVITTAGSLAVHLGCTQIAFVGVDLGYPVAQPYARHTIWEAGWQAQVTPDLSLAAIWRLEITRKATKVAADEWGRWVLTSPVFLLTRDWLVGQAAHFQRAAPGRSVVNLSETGLLFDPQWVPRKTWDEWRGVSA